MSLTLEQKARRHGKIGASIVPCLMAGAEEPILHEWMRLVEHPDYVEEDLSANWPVQFGSYIETFALDWHEAKTGQPLTRRGEHIVHPEKDYVGCTLDAWRGWDRCVIDCKAPGRWRVLDDVLAYYPGQLVVQAGCVGAEHAALLVVHGGDEPREYEIQWDPDYEAEVWTRVEWLWSCVERLEPPFAIPPAKGIVPAVRIVDMSESNSWAEYAAQWLGTKDAAKVFAEATKGVKSLMEDDVAKAFGHGICASRNRAGSVAIREAK